jgi:hypothetical protein
MRERYKVAFGVSCCFSLSLNLAYLCAAHTQDVVSKQFLSSLSTAVAGDLVLLEFMTSLHRGLLDTQLGRIDTEDVNKAGLAEDALFWLLVALSRSAAVITRIAELFPPKVPPPPPLPPPPLSPPSTRECTTRGVRHRISALILYSLCIVIAFCVWCCSRFNWPLITWVYGRMFPWQCTLWPRFARRHRANTQTQPRCHWTLHGQPSVESGPRTTPLECSRWTQDRCLAGATTAGNFLSSRDSSRSAHDAARRGTAHRRAKRHRGSSTSGCAPLTRCARPISTFPNQRPPPHRLS